MTGGIGAVLWKFEGANQTEVNKSLRVRTVLITGASAGIGAAVACRLAKDGYRVYGTTRNLANLGGAPRELQEATLEKASAPPFYPVRFLELDVTRDDSVQKCVSQVLSETDGIDVLINNAGWGTFGPVEELPVETAQALFDTIVFGALRMIRAVAPLMRERRAGTIINITSIAARAVIPFQAHYSAAKAALEALTIGLRQEMAPFGVQVAALEPSDINTRFNDVTVFAPATGADYQPWTEPCWRVIAENLPKAPPPEVVADKVAAILRSRSLKPVYTCGLAIQRAAPFAFRLMPKSAEISAMRVFYGLGFSKLRPPRPHQRRGK